MSTSDPSTAAGAGAPTAAGAGAPTDPAVSSRWQVPHDHPARRHRARSLVAQRGGTHLLVTDPLNVRYLSGFTGSNGQLLIGSDPAEDVLITDHRYDERAAVEAPGLTRVLDRDPVAVVLDRLTDPSTGSPSGATGAADEGEVACAGGDDGDGAAGGAGGGAAVGAAVGAGTGPRLLVEEHHLTWAAADDLLGRAQRRVAVGRSARLVEALRVLKDDAEVERLTAACAITTESLAWLLEEVVAVGRTERELATALERRFVDAGADGRAFASIVASGANAAIPHHEPTDRRLAAGDLLTIDCGALVDGYHADHTRTVAIGHLADELRVIHELVVAAQAAGVAVLRPGVTGGEVDAAARSVIEAAGHGAAFVHGTGHGVGLAIHEDPAVGRGSAATLAAGVVCTVEPGIYLPGIGGVRIEDTLVVTADGTARSLTDTPRELRIL